MTLSKENKTQYWLFKTEPDVFSIDDLKNSKNMTDSWDGVRNYQARNFMRDQIKKGDIVLFYHSRCDPPGIVGLAEVVKEGHPDHTSWNKNSKYFDPKSSPENPRWFMVDVKWKQKFKRKLSLGELKEYPELKDMKLLQKGMRLSIQPVTVQEYKFILNLA